MRLRGWITPLSTNGSNFVWTGISCGSIGGSDRMTGKGEDTQTPRGLLGLPDMRSHRHPAQYPGRDDAPRTFI